MVISIEASDRRLSETVQTRICVAATLKSALPVMMTKQESGTSFEAAPDQQGTGWHVNITWPSGRADHLCGFVSDREANAWIFEKSAWWLDCRSKNWIRLP